MITKIVQYVLGNKFRVNGTTILTLRHNSIVCAHELMTDTNAQEQVTIELFKRNMDVLTPEVAGLTSGRYNAKYTAKDLITYAMMQCAESTYAETMVRNLQRVSESAGPTPHWFRGPPPKRARRRHAADMPLDAGRVGPKRQG